MIWFIVYPPTDTKEEMAIWTINFCHRYLLLIDASTQTLLISPHRDFSLNRSTHLDTPRCIHLKFRTVLRLWTRVHVFWASAIANPSLEIQVRYAEFGLYVRSFVFDVVDCYFRCIYGWCSENRLMQQVRIEVNRYICARTNGIISSLNWRFVIII